MPDTNITIDSKGNITRGTPGKMTELDVEHKGGHVTGRTEHVRPQGDKPATTRRAPKSKAMSLDQIIGRGGSGEKPAEAATTGKKAAQPKREPKPKAPAAAPAPEPVTPAPAPVPEPAPQPVQESPAAQPDDTMWTAEAEQARDSGMPYLTIEHNGITLNFTQNDINTARNTPSSERDEWDQALVDFGDKVDKERREEAERAEAARKAQEEATAKQASQQPKEEPPAPEPVAEEPKSTEESKPEGSRRLNLSTSAPTHKEQPPEGPVEEAPPVQEGHVLQAPASTDEPLRRVSFQDICTTLELDAKDLLASLQSTARGADLGINPALHLYYITSHDGDTTYLFGYGANIAYVRVRGGILRDCNNRFGIDEVCAWVNEMTWVVRRIGG